MGRTTDTIDSSARGRLGLHAYVHIVTPSLLPPQQQVLRHKHKQDYTTKTIQSLLDE